MLRKEVRTYSLKMTSIASDRLPTYLNYLPFRSMLMKDRRKSEDGTSRNTSHILIIHYKLLDLHKASAEILYQKLRGRIRCNETR